MTTQSRRQFLIQCQIKTTFFLLGVWAVCEMSLIGNISYVAVVDADDDAKVKVKFFINIVRKNGVKFPSPHVRLLSTADLFEKRGQFKDNYKTEK